MPSGVVSYVNTQHQGSDIKKIERKKNGYKVKVDNKHVSSDIHFDKSGKWKKTEHDD
ncbi:PepSY-like domain-containing protein [Gabonia massiliensis]|uniref:PepSY-like domain-containing protein n=1 Tax=Gabonia massiliensis TaxID=1686296 RepID=UPI00398326DC